MRGPLARFLLGKLGKKRGGAEPGPVSGDGLLLESGAYFLLLESGDFLLLE